MKLSGKHLSVRFIAVCAALSLGVGAGVYYRYSNKLQNIDGISCKMLSKSSIDIMFKYSETDDGFSGHINEDQLKVAIVNTADLRLF